MRNLLLLLTIFLFTFSSQAQPTGTVVGTTTYDLQTNATSPNRIYVDQLGRIGVAWTGSADFSGTWPDRGSFYNYYDGSSWGTAPTARIESIRTGWPELVFSGSVETVISHDPSGFGYCVVNARPAGTGNVWNETIPTGTLEGMWPRAAATGSNMVHMVNANYQSAAGNNFVQYFRSPDGGFTWDIQAHRLPGVDTANGYNIMSAEVYNIAVQQSKVAVVAAESVNDLAVWVSDANGDVGTWARTRILDFPFDNFDGNVITDLDGDGVGDPITTNDGTHTILIDNNGTVHIWSGLMQIVDDVPGDDAWNYFPATNGFLYWNETFGPDSVQILDFGIDWDCSGVNYDNIGDDLNAYGGGITSAADAALDPTTGNLYLVYMSRVDGTSNTGNPLDPGAESYNDIFGVYSTDNGQTWTQPVNLTQSASDSYENAHPSIHGEVVNGKIHMLWMRDDDPGNALEADPDLLKTNEMVYHAFDVTDFDPSIANTGQFTITNDVSVCAGGSVQLNVNTCGLTTPTYQWSPTLGLSNPNIANPVASPVISTIYTVTVTDANLNTYIDSVTVSVNSSGCYPRRVLLEEFTNASAPPDAFSNPPYDSLVSANPDKVASVKFHTSWVGVDPFYSFNPTQNDDRVNFYTVTAIPDVRIDGTASVHPMQMTQAFIDDRYNTPTPVFMEIDEVLNGNQVDITVTATIDDVITDPLAIFVAVIEDSVAFATPPGTNGETVFRQAMRYMLPTSNGTAVSVPTVSGQTETVNVSYTIHPDFIPEELRTVAWLQNLNTLEVYQSAITPDAPAPHIPDCSIDTSLTMTGLYPAAEDLGCFVNGDTAIQNIQFNTPVSVDLTDFGLNGIIGTVDFMLIDSIEGLPSGLDYSCHNFDCEFIGGTAGCLTIAGVPNDVAGMYILTFHVSITTTLPIIGTFTFQATLDQLGFDYHLLVIDPGMPCANDPMVLSVSPSDTAICPGETVTLNSTVIGGSAPYSYSWMPTAGIANPNVADAVVSPAATTTYLLTVVDNDGDTATAFAVVNVGSVPGGINCCSIDNSITDFDFYPAADSIACIEEGMPYSQDIQIYMPAQVDLTPFGLPGIVADLDWLQIDSIGGLPTGMTYGCNVPGCQMPGNSFGCVSFSGTTNDTVGNYDLTVYFTMEVTVPIFGTQTVSGEFSEFGILYHLTVIPPGGVCANGGAALAVDILQSDTMICSGDAVQLNTLVTGGESPYSYVWTPATALSNANVSNPFASPTAVTTYLVTVTDNQGNTATDFVVITIDNSAACITCDQPVNLPQPAQVQNQLTFTWPLEDDASQTQLQFRVKPGQIGAVPDNGTSIANGTTTTKTVTIDTANCGLIYQARLRHRCGTIFSPWKFRVNIPTFPCLRVGQFSEELEVYPNPASDVATVQFYASKNSDAVIEVLDMTGKVVYASNYELVKGINLALIDLETMGGGIYMVSLKYEGKAFVQKLLVVE